MRIFSSAGKTLLFEQTLSVEMCCVETNTYRNQKKPYLVYSFSSAVNTVAESSSLILAILISVEFVSICQGLNRHRCLRNSLN